MKSFVDTSAFLALLVPSDRAHPQAREIFERLRAEEAALVTTSYVLIETYALLAARLGPAACRAFREGFEPLLEIVWIDEDLHERAVKAWLGRSRAGASLVDEASFVVMQQVGVDTAFAFDDDFSQAGFSTH